MREKKWFQKKRFWLALGSLAGAGMYAAGGQWPEAARAVLTAFGLAG